MSVKKKQSTAFTTIVGPILDANGVEYASAVIGDLDITKNGTNAAMAAAATLTIISNGRYTLVATTGNTDTVGELVISCNKATYQMKPIRFEVLPATTFDALVTNAATAAGGLQDVQRINGVAATSVTTIKAVLGLAVDGVVTSVTNPVQVNNIGESSAALNAISTAFTQTTGGVTSGTYASTATLNGVSHITTDTTGTLDEYYDCSLGTTGQIGTSVQFEGYLVGVTNSLNVYAYNWVGSNWDQIGTLVGVTTVTDQLFDYDLVNSHTSGTGVVRIRFQNTGLTAASLNIDRLLVGYTVVLSPPTNWSALGIGSNGHILNVDGTVAANVTQINGASTAAVNLGAVYAAFETGTAQAGAASTITLRSGASASNDYYKDQVIFCLSGTGAGQTNRISSYVGSTKVATVETAWVTQPDATTVYFVLGRIG